MSKIIKFAHMADLHLGAWREKRLTQLNLHTFKKAIIRVLDEQVDFCIFAGDIFNNAMPPLELVHQVVKELMKLKEKNIGLYVIGGSHDYSYTGKSFIELLESAGVFVDVGKHMYVDKGKIQLKFTKDKSGTVISGVLGRKNGLDKNIYMNLDEHTLNKENFNLFLFHTTLSDFKPDFLKNVDVKVNSTFLPKGFDYYAGGHVHTYLKGVYNDATLSYPGPLFPNNFLELIREEPSFNLCEFDMQNRKVKIERIFLNTYEKIHIKINIGSLNPVEVKNLISEEVEKTDLENKVVLLEISGIVDGKISDIKLNEIISEIYKKSALHVLKNTYKLTSSSLQKLSVDVHKTMEDLENDIISEGLKDSKNNIDEHVLIKNLLKLELSKFEGEKVAQYEQRVIEAIGKSLNI